MEKKSLLFHEAKALATSARTCSGPRICERRSWMHAETRKLAQEKDNTPAVPIEKAWPASDAIPLRTSVQHAQPHCFFCQVRADVRALEGEITSLRRLLGDMRANAAAAGHGHMGTVGWIKKVALCRNLSGLRLISSSLWKVVKILQSP